MAEEYSYTESVQMACSNIYWSCDCFLFLFVFPMAYVPKHPTTQKSAVCSESLICLYAKVSNRHTHYFCLVL